jgi:hypothetical protein
MAAAVVEVDYAGDPNQKSQSFQLAASIAMQPRVVLPFTGLFLNETCAIRYKDACRTPLEVPGPEGMLVKLEIHSLAAEGDALHPQTEALFGSGFKAQLDLSPRTHHSLPREPVGRFRLKEARDSAMI